MNSDPRYAKDVTKQIAKQMGLKLECAKNIVEMHSSMADQLNFSSAMRNLAADLNRISNDLRLLSSGPTSGIGEINLPPEEFETEACVLALDLEFAKEAGLDSGTDAGGLRGVGELIQGLVPLFVRVDPADVKAALRG